jgi:hypothetical protein
MSCEKKKRYGIAVRVSEDDLARYTMLAESTKVPLAMIIRLLLDAAIDCVEKENGWPREIAVVKKGRAGGATAPIATSATTGTYEGQTRSLSPANAYADPQTATKRPPRVHQSATK